MDDNKKRTLHFRAFFVFLMVSGWLTYAGAWQEGNLWIHAAYFILGASFGIGLLTKRRTGNVV
jgi:hypothetical protein